MPNLLEMGFDDPIENDKIIMRIRANGTIGISIKMEIPGRGLVDIGRSNFGGGYINRSHILVGGINSTQYINLVIQGGDAGPELVKALRGAADDLDHALRGK